MKRLNELMNTDIDIEVTGIKTNSKEIEKGNIFICTDRGTLDRHDFIDDAIENIKTANRLGINGRVVEKNSTEDIMNILKEYEIL